jgi:predicted PurR-regulated permease PerM
MADPTPATPPPPPDDPSTGTPVAASEPAPRRHRPLTLRHYVAIAVAAALFFALLRQLGQVLTPFLVGAILAYLGTPMVDAMERRGVHRAIGTTLAIIAFGIAIAGLFIVLIPLVQAEAALAAKRVPDLLAQAGNRIVPWLEQTLRITIALDIDTLKALVADHLDSVRDLGLRVLSGVKSGGRLLLTVLVNVALIPVVMWYLLRDWNVIVRRIDDLLPRPFEHKIREIARDVDSVLAEFLRGQLSVMLALAAYYAIALWAVGLDHAFAIGVVTGLLVFIPYVGYGLGLTLGLAAALLQWSGWPFFVAVLGVYLIGQLLENYVLIPWLVGDRIGLHPLAVIFALLAFGQLFGFAGVLLALPISAALLVGLRQIKALYVSSPLYDD